MPPVVLIFFVEAVSTEGRVVHDARKVVIRDDRIYSLDPRASRGSEGP